jgi:hypothetical protein
VSPKIHSKHLPHGASSHRAGNIDVNNVDQNGSGIVGGYPAPRNTRGGTTGMDERLKRRLLMAASSATRTPTQSNNQAVSQQAGGRLASIIANRSIVYSLQWRSNRMPTRRVFFWRLLCRS